jgi:hypothetical protein
VLEWVLVVVDEDDLWARELQTLDDLESLSPGKNSCCCCCCVVCGPGIGVSVVLDLHVEAAVTERGGGGKVLMSGRWAVIV